MARFAIVKFSELNVRCMSSLRYTGLCKCCQRVEICKLPEAARGRLELEVVKLEKVNAELSAAEQKFQAAEKENNEKSGLMFNNWREA
ncbi:MAG TPA: hypothetical protein PLP33_29175 [Leptospiraceae bacterium]|nr:hypothetical protein [Leptospiraceae bacterium]